MTETDTAPIFEELLKTSTKIYDLVSESGRNIASMVSSMTILVEKEACEIEKIREMGIKIQDDGEKIKHKKINTIFNLME